MPELSIVVPTYRSVNHIHRFLTVLKDAVGGLDVELVLVDDGSPDTTYEACETAINEVQLEFPVKLVQHMRNYGEHAAVLTGLNHASGSFIVTMDDDLQNPPEEVPRLLEAIKERPRTDVLYARAKIKEHAAWRNWGSQFANFVVTQLGLKPKRLYLSSFRIMRRQVAEEVIKRSVAFPYIDGVILNITQRLDSIEVQHNERAEGESNYNLGRLAHLWTSVLVGASIRPLRALLLYVLAIVLGIVSFVIWIFIDTVIFGNDVAGWASTVLLVAATAAVQMLVLVLIGEYVGRIHLTAAGLSQRSIRTEQSFYQDR